MLAAMLLLTGMASGQRSYVPIDQPQFLQVEPIEFVVPGVSHYGWTMALRLMKATWHSGSGFRAGISGWDVSAPIDIDGDGTSPWGYSIAPVHIGYDIVLSPRKTGFFYGTVPSCYAEATLGAFPPYAKVAAACDIDYYGIGTGIEVGIVDWNRRYENPGPHAVLAFRPAIYASLKLRLLDAAFRLPRHK
jgi:hypothetical protein